MKKRYLTGLDKARRVFKTLPAENLEQIVDALNRGAMEIRERAILLAPHDPSTSIDLKDQIDVVVATKKNARSRKVPVQPGPNSVAAYVVAGNTPERKIAAFAQEFGRAPGPDGHPGHPAQPFLFPAYFSIRRRVRNRVSRAISKAAKLVVARAR